MTVRRWDPLRDLFLLQERMDELFEESLSKGRQSRANAWMPLADAWELDDEFVVTLEVPGVDEADLRIDLDGEDLVVRGERRSPELRGESYHRMERIHGTFARTFRLTCPVDFDRVSAELKDGVLRVELPKEAPRSRVVRAERAP